MDIETDGRFGNNRLGPGSGGAPSSTNGKVCKQYWRAGWCNRFPCRFLHSELPEGAPPKRPTGPGGNGGHHSRWGNGSGIASHKPPDTDKCCKYFLAGTECSHGERCRFQHSYCMKGHAKHLMLMEPQNHGNTDDQFVWPLMGVLVNVPTEWKNGRQVDQLKEQLARFCPQKVIPLWNYRGHTGSAIVEFAKDWTGFINALAFENHFEAEGYGERDWRLKYKGSWMFGWVAKADDLRSHGPIGDYLQKNADLKTVS